MWFWRRRKERGLEEEVRSHLEMAAKERVERGEERKEAERAVRREFGNVGLVKEVTREMWGLRWLEDLAEDARFGLRTLSKNPGFTTIAVLTLALGIGANSAIFSLVNAILLKPLSYAHSERLVMAWEKVRLPSYQNDRNDPAPGNFVDWQKQNTVFQDMAAIRYRSFNLTGEGEPVRVEGEGVSASVFPMSASAVTFLPLTQARGSKGFSIEGRAPFSPGQIPMADYDVMTPGYFQTMRIPLIEGRDFSWDDHSQTRRVIVINESMARTFWPREDPLNKRIKEGQLDDPAPWLTVVGVVGDIRQFNVATEPRPAMYFPVTQFEDARGVLRDWIVRSSGDSPALAAAVCSVIWSLDKDLPISRVRSMEQVRSTSVAPQAFNLLLLGLSGCLALILAAVGLYGVTSYAVAQRTHEIGIRMALGARPRDVRQHILKEGTRLAMTGLGVGAVAALALSRLIASLLYGITSTDPMTFAAVAFVLTIVAVAACWIPARRATRVDPIEALRYE